MKIPKAYLIDPGRNGVYGMAAIAVSMFVFAYSTHFGKVAILAYYGCWLPLVLVDYRRVLGNYARFHWIIALAAFACISTFWSLAPNISARASVQYASHVVCALIAARVISAPTLANGVNAGVFIVLIYSLAFGGYHYDPIDRTYSFVGAFASKNQLGFFASLGVFFAGMSLFVLKQKPAAKMLALGGGILATYSLFASQSATSVIGIAAAFAVMGGLRLILALHPRVRKASLVVALGLAVAAVFVAINMGAVETVLAAFGKDATLTGRTYLWSEGLAAFRQAPFLGTGYQAYWVQGFSEAERLWAEFYIATRDGFHFHNTYIETLVELGLVGCLLVAALLAIVTVGHLVRVLDAGRDRAAFALFGLAVMLVIRSFVEVDTLYPYTAGSFLVYYAAGVLAAARSRELLEAQPQPVRQAPTPIGRTRLGFR